MAHQSAAAGENLKEASRTGFQTFKWKIGAFLGGIGAAVGAVFGAVPGAAVGGAGGAVVGASVGKGLEKSGEKRIDRLEFKRPSNGGSNHEAEEEDKRDT